MEKEKLKNSKYYQGKNDKKSGDLFEKPDDLSNNTRKHSVSEQTVTDNQDDDYKNVTKKSGDESTLDLGEKGKDNNNTQQESFYDKEEDKVENQERNSN